MTSKIECPKEFSDVNEENTPCSNCGSRIHYISKNLICCSYCNAVIDQANPIFDNEGNIISFTLSGGNLTELLEKFNQ